MNPNFNDMPRQLTYIVGVSGGVDSVVLLDMFSGYMSGDVGRVVVAHINHGLRTDATHDEQFTASLAAAYGHDFRSLKMGATDVLSEETGRKARYDFFRQLAHEYQAAGVVTAHHADDAIETVAINISRGTGWRGLSVLRSEVGMWRPLIGLRKPQLYEYAVQKRLEWCEDSTNQTDDYLRNRLRRGVLPRLEQHAPGTGDRLLELRQAQLHVRSQIEQVLQGLVPRGTTYLPKLFLDCESAVAEELLRYFLRQHNVSQTIPQVRRALEFARGAGNKKRFSLNRQQFLQVNRDGLVVVGQENW